MKKKVLIVDDSALVRQILQQMISESDELEVVGVAEDPYEAREKIKTLHPDVLTLDIEMPKMDGVTFLKNLMRLHPMPVVMISSLTEAGADITLECLSLGAVDFVTKPKIDLSNSLENYQHEILRKVTAASRVTKSALERQYQRYVNGQNSRPEMAHAHSPAPSARPAAASSAAASGVNRAFAGSSNKLIAIGASTGGTEAIKEVLIRLPQNTPPIVITQHIPAAFSLPFAQRMDRVSEMTVHHAEDGQEILPGNVYIAPGDKHLVVTTRAGKMYCSLNDGPPVNRHKPSVEVMFQSVLQNVTTKGVAVMLTGMGADGARAMKDLRTSGVKTICQDENTSVVWGMPGEAHKIGAADETIPLDRIAQRVLDLI